MSLFRSLPLLLALVASPGQDLPADTLPGELSASPPAGFELADYRPTMEAPGLAALGRALFFDPILSRDKSVACASCHRPNSGFADPRPASKGVGGQLTPRNAPSLLNRALGRSFMWDGRAASLEVQVLQPIENPVEMDLPLELALDRLSADPEYRAAFQEVLGGPATRDGLADALASFVRRLWIGDSPVDRFRAGERSALNEAELAGFWLYESRGGCWRCHSGPNFSDEGFHNTGIGAEVGQPDVGRGAVTGDPMDRGAFKTPTLRGLTLTGPYMHDGGMGSLREVVEFYRSGGGENVNLSTLLSPLELSDGDVENLVAFLEALSR